MHLICPLVLLHSLEDCNFCVLRCEWVIVVYLNERSTSMVILATLTLLNLTCTVALVGSVLSGCFERINCSYDQIKSGFPVIVLPLDHGSSSLPWRWWPDTWWETGNWLYPLSSLLCWFRSNLDNIWLLLHAVARCLCSHILLDYIMRLCCTCSSNLITCGCFWFY